MIIIPSKKFVDMPEIKAAIGMAGKFIMRAKRGPIVVREAVFDNLILDQGLNFMATQNGPYYYCRVGTGTAAPANGQTGLVSDFGVVASLPASSQSNSGAPNYIQRLTQVFTFAVDAVIGNVNEVGVFQSTAANSAFSRALTLDNSGNPTSFPVLSGEQLEVTYILDMYPPMGDWLLTQLIGASSYDVTVRAHSVNANWRFQNTTRINMAYAPGGTMHMASSGTLVPNVGGATTFPTPNLGTATSVANGNYTAGSFQRTFTGTFNPTVGNGAMLSFAAILNCCAFQWQYDRPVNKTNLQTFVQPFTVGWGRLP